MVGMTSLAWSVVEILDSSMETLFGVDVCSNFLVTLETQFVLAHLAETFMAVAAFIFILGMNVSAR